MTTARTMRTQRLVASEGVQPDRACDHVRGVSADPEAWVTIGKSTVGRRRVLIHYSLGVNFGGGAVDVVERNDLQSAAFQ